MNHEKYIPETADLQDVVNLWRDVFGLHKHGFHDKKSMSEKDLSMRTWEGCTGGVYEEDPSRYQRWNDKVKALFNQQMPSGVMLLRLRSKFFKRGKGAVSKICKADKNFALDKLKVQLNVAVGNMATAFRINERMKLKHNIGKQVFGGVVTRLEAEGFKNVGKHLLQQQVNEFAKIEYVKGNNPKDIKNDIVSGVLGVLDSKLALTNKDDEYAEKFGEAYGTSNKNRRKIAQNS
jgi:hypothetical protein